MLNVVICGTPGTGKSSLIDILKSDKMLEEFRFINLSQFAKDNDCICSYDNVLESDVIDEDKLSIKLDQILDEQTFSIIESIHADLLPVQHITHVFVCRTDNTILFDRLKERNYNDEKIANNVQAEIFQTIYDEVLESFDRSIITSLINNENHELELNAKIVMDFIRSNLKKQKNTG